MPIRKRRPIVMNRNKNSGKTGVIIRKALLITAILASIEVVVLIVVHFLKRKQEITLSKSKKPAVSRIANNNVLRSHKATTTRDTTVVRDQIKQPIDTIEAPSPIPQQVVSGSPNSLNSPVKKTVKKSGTSLTKQRLFEILNEVRMVKMRANNPARCISIKIINSSNVSNGSRIVNYLRNNGYIISGREVVGGSQKGIRVDANGTCLHLAIGTL